MALLAQSYPVICEVERTRKVLLSGMDVYYGWPLMHDDSDGDDAGSASTTDDNDRFAGIALETIFNASDLQGAAQTVYVNVMRKGSYIAELSTTPTITDLGKAVYVHATDAALVDIAESNTCLIGFIEEWQNVGDPMGRANAVKVRIGGLAESTAAGA